MKKILQNIVSQNTYINKIIYQYLFIYETQRVQQLVNDLTTDDYMIDISKIRRFRKTIKDNFSYVTRDITWNNLHIYGIWNAIFYKFLKEENYKSPCIEHGLIFHNEVYRDVLYSSRMSCCTFSKFRKEIIQRKINKPVFCIGPYIYYANQFYNDKKLENLKQKLGTTLLVFPTHSTDCSDISFNQEVFLKNIKKISSKYNSVLINVFWWNINDPLIFRLEAEGYKVITCGFRDDINFLPRLKSYLSLADLVIGDSIGTHVGYCVSNNVPFCYIPSETKVNLKIQEENNDIDFMQHHLNKIGKEFLHSTNITEKQKEICNYYWGNNLVKNNEQIIAILRINTDLLKLTKGFLKLTDKAAYELLNIYQKRNMYLERSLLFDALNESKRHKLNL